jgi:hypothetical protein
MYTVHHFGMVRDAAVLRYKWWIQGRAVLGRSTQWTPPKLLFLLFPHDWMVPEFFADLATYRGQDILAVREDPKEFTRDAMKFIRAIESR